MAVQASADTTFQSLSMCVDDVARWFLENGLLLNLTKTEAVLFGTTTQRKKIPTASGIDVAGSVVPFSDTVKLLGVTLDSSLSMNRRGGPQLQRSHTCAASHQTTADTGRRQVCRTQHRLIATGLCQRTAVWYIGRQPSQAAGCSEVRTRWLERCVRPRALSVPPSYVGSSTGFQSGKESYTSLPSSPPRPPQPRLRLTCLTLFTIIIILQALCDLLTNCYLLYRECR